MGQLKSGTTIAGYLALHYGNDGHIASFINLAGNDLQLQHRDGTVLDTVDLASYITGHVDITPGSSVAAQTGGNVISQLTLDADGHTTLTATRNMWAEKHILTKENNISSWTHALITEANISLELGTNSNGGVGSLKQWSYSADEFTLIRQSNGNMHLDSTQGKFYFNWDTGMSGVAGQILLGTAAGAAGITLNASSASVFTSSITWSGGSSANANTAYDHSQAAHAPSNAEANVGDTFSSTGTYAGLRAQATTYGDVGAAPAAGSSSIVTVGTIGTGTWQGTAIAAGYMASHAPASHAFSVHTGTLGVSQGGTGAGTHTSGNVLIGAGTGAITSLSRSGIDTRSTFPATSHAFSVHSGTLAVSQGGTGLTSGYNKTNWDLAHGWGDHAAAGYASAAGYLPLAGGTMTGTITSTPGNDQALFTFTAKNTAGETSNIIQFGGADSLDIPGATDRYEHGFLINTGATPRNFFIKATSGTVNLVTDLITVTGGNSTEWNTGYDHSQAAHAPSNAEANVGDTFSNTGTYAGLRAQATTYGDVGAAPAAGNSSIVTVGTIGTGTWQGTAIAAGYMASHAPASHAFSVHSGTLGVSQGGTGAGTHTSGNVLIGAGTGAVTSLSRSGIDTRSTFPSASHAFSVHSGTLAVSQGGTGLTSGYNKTNWDLAHGWGDHGTEGYITTTGVTHTALNNNGDIGTGAAQVANGDHSHSEFGALAVIDDYFWVKHSSSADAEGIRMAITGLTNDNTSSEIFFVENGALSYGAKIAYDGSNNYLYFQRVEASTTHTVMTIKRTTDVVLFASTPTVAGTAMVLTDDSRLSDSRTPTSHLITSHTGVSDYSIGVRNGAGAGSITEVSLASTNQVIGRLGAGVVAIDIGTGAGDVAAGDHTHSYLSTSGGTVDGNVQIGNSATDEWWLTLLGGVDTAERTGITIGESGKWGAAALHIYYTGDGYGHIGMGAMTGSTDADYDHIRFKYNSADMDFYSAINHTADYVGTGNVTLNWGEVNNAFTINSGYGSADTDSFSITKYSSDNQFLLNSDSYLRMSSHFVPHVNDLYDLGASSNKWRDLYVNDQITATGDGHSLGNTTITDLHISDTTTSTTTSTGAFTVAGGAGILENLHVGGYVGHDASHYIDPWYGTLPNASYTGMRFSIYTETARGFWFGDSNDTTPTLFASPNFSGSGVRRVGINHVGSSTYTLYVSGGIGATGNIVGYASDATLKKNVATIAKPLNTLRQVRGVSFDWNALSTKESYGDHPEGEHDIGFIAQELQQVLPELVIPWDKDKGLLTVRYDRIVPLLVEGIKELDSEITSLRTEITKLKEDMVKRLLVLEKK